MIDEDYSGNSLYDEMKRFIGRSCVCKGVAKEHDDGGAREPSDCNHIFRGDGFMQRTASSLYIKRI